MGEALDLRQTLNLLGIDADDVEHAVGQQPDLSPIDLSDDRDVSGCRLGQALAEAAAQIDDRDPDAAQVKDAADVAGLPRQMLTSVNPLISRTDLMSNPYCSQPIAKGTNCVVSATLCAAIAEAVLAQRLAE